MRRFAAGLFAALSLAALDASAIAPNISKVTPVAPGQKQGCPAGTVMKTDPSCNPLKNRGCTPFACVSTGGARRRAAAPPKSCPKADPLSKVTPKC